MKIRRDIQLEEHNTFSGEDKEEAMAKIRERDGLRSLRAGYKIND